MHLEPLDGHDYAKDADFCLEYFGLTDVANELAATYAERVQAVFADRHDDDAIVAERKSSFGMLVRFLVIMSEAVRRARGKKEEFRTAVTNRAEALHGLRQSVPGRTPLESHAYMQLVRDLERDIERALDRSTEAH